MGVECRIHFNTSFRTTMYEGNISCFFDEGFCELYGAGNLKTVMDSIDGEFVYIYQNNLKIDVDAYGNKLRTYPLKLVLEKIKDTYRDYMNGNKSSLTVCIGILESILQNSSNQNPIVMLYFH